MVLHQRRDAEHGAVASHAGHREGKATGEHSGHDEHAGHSVEMFRDRFWVSLALSAPVYRKMLQTLLWGAGYNAITAPVATRVLAPPGIILAPSVGAVLMSVSTIVVALNARLLRRWNRSRNGPLVDARSVAAQREGAVFSAPPVLSSVT
jgi:hypothetical protein